MIESHYAVMLERFVAFGGGLCLGDQPSGFDGPIATL
jgi:hypothetical protein